VNDTVGTLTDQAWARVLERDPVTAARLGCEVTALPPGGIAQLEQDVDAARHALAALPADEHSLAAEFLRDHLSQEIAEAGRFWYRFPVTPYNAMLLAGYRELVERDAGLLRGYIAVVEELTNTLHEQRLRGITLPGWAIGSAVDTVHGHAEAAAGLGSDRLATAFDGLLDEVTAGSGPDGVGIGQYPGGAECYAGLILLHTGLDLTAERVHQLGLSEVARITEEIRELGIRDETRYRQQLERDPRMYARDPSEVERVFQGHLDRLRPHLPDQFASLPTAPFRLRRLAPALEGGLTYGYYEPPGAEQAGYYHYNGSDLANRPLLQAASLIYHEGMPGHHLQLARQRENAALHPLRREVTELRTFALNAYYEGWAEYAAGLCAELGLYADPMDRYGRMCAERFQAARLVVDTGLNVLGWSRERAASYLRANGYLSEVEVETELLRYALDDPGQALAYHVGHWYLRELRGNREPREFHEAVLADGPLPLRLIS
jgi:uncharacterized protein (DUF885 family)